SHSVAAGPIRSTVSSASSSDQDPLSQRGNAMPDVVPYLKLTHTGARRILDAAIAKAEAMKVPQCIAIVDDGGHLLAFTRMDGAKVLSIDSSLRKAMTAASSRVPTGKIEAGAT